MKLTPFTTTLLKGPHLLRHPNILEIPWCSIQFQCLFPFDLQNIHQHFLFPDIFVLFGSPFVKKQPTCARFTLKKINREGAERQISAKSAESKDLGFSMVFLGLVFSTKNGLTCCIRVFLVRLKEDIYIYI